MRTPSQPTTSPEGVRTQLVAMGLLENESSVTDHESLMEAGVLDSLRLMDLVPALEKRFGITVEAEDLTPENFDSISAISNFVTEKGRGLAVGAGDV